MTVTRTTLRTRRTYAATAALAVAGSLLAVAPSALAATPSSLAQTVVSAASVARDQPVVRRGSTGAAVREWQTVVTWVLGSDSIAVDGVFGPRTESATREVQRLFDLVDDGVVGPRTWGATSIVHSPEGEIADEQAGTDGSVSAVGHLELGDRGAQVEQWQRMLDSDPRSTSATSVDGVFGPATLASTKAFQTRYGLVPDGVVGPRSRATMQEVLADV